MALLNSNDDIIPLTVPVAIPVGELVVVSLVTRGSGTQDVVDTANNPWLLDAEAVNGSGVETVAIYDCVLTHPLPVGATITAILPQNTDRARSIQGYWVHGLIEFDRANGAQDNGNRITVSTGQPLRGTQHVAFVALGTGFNDPTLYSGFAPFVEASHFATTFSSGAHLVRTGTGWAGQPLVATADANNDAQHVGVIVSFR